MLAGLIVNNGIVLIDYINQARREGMSKHEAIIDAGRTRLRPILMTAMTTILAMFTSAIGIGAVSYTHRDVYKRQFMHICRLCTGTWRLGRSF